MIDPIDVLPPLVRGAERAALSKLVIHLVSNTARACCPGLETVPRRVLTMFAVFIGHHEKRPMSAHKIAAFTGMSRSSVERNLAALVQIGMIERHRGATYRMTEQGAARGGVDERVKKNMRMVADTLAQYARNGQLSPSPTQEMCQTGDARKGAMGRQGAMESNWKRRAAMGLVVQLPANLLDAQEILVYAREYLEEMAADSVVIGNGLAKPHRKIETEGGSIS